MPTVSKTLGEGTQSVLLTVAILECLAAAPQPTGLSELAKTIATSKSRIFRHLRTLLACDYVVQDEASGRYGIGPRLLALARATSDRHDLGRLALPYMERLSERFHNSAIVSRVEPEGVRVIHSVSGHASIVLGVRAGSVLPYDRSAQGKIALAFGGPELDAPRARFEEQAPGELASIRDAGIAVAQMREGWTGMASPVFDANGRLTGTLALLNTASEMKASRKEAGAALRRAAIELSRLLGYAGS
jgi:IclR family transcriptional regulator, KDG regulon repressor